MIERYLHESQVLKAVFLLIDIRHEPSANDVNMYQWILANGYEPIIIATKADKIKRSQLQKHIKMIKTELNVVPGTKVLTFSALTNRKDEILDLIEEISGGIKMALEAETLYKLIIMHMLNKVEFPLTNSQISQFFLENEYTNYFTVQKSLSELIEDGFVFLNINRNTSYYHLTSEGREVIKFFREQDS